MWPLFVATIDLIEEMRNYFLDVIIDLCDQSLERFHLFVNLSSQARYDLFLLLNLNFINDFFSCDMLELRIAASSLDCFFFHFKSIT